MQISQLAFNVPEDLEERLDALANEREEIASQQEKRYLFSAAQNELHEIASSYSQKISGAVNRRDYRQKRIAEIRQQEEFMKNSGCPDIENASCRFLSKAVEDLRYGRNAQNTQFHTSKTREKPGEKCRKPLASMDIIGRKKHWKA